MKTDLSVFICVHLWLLLDNYRITSHNLRQSNTQRLRSGRVRPETKAQRASDNEKLAPTPERNGPQSCSANALASSSCRKPPPLPLAQSISIRSALKSNALLMSGFATADSQRWHHGHTTFVLWQEKFLPRRTYFCLNTQNRVFKWECATQLRRVTQLRQLKEFE